MLLFAAGQHMGQAIKTVVYTYDPEVIVVGGSLSKAYPFFKDAMFQSLSDFTFPESIKRLHVFQSVDENITLLGAAALLDGAARMNLKTQPTPGRF
jgi:glucokinase